MEFKEYFKIIKSNIFLIIVSVILFLAGGLIYYFYETEYFKGEVIFSVVKSSENQEVAFEDINYDGYYLIESQRNFGRKIGDFLITQSKYKNDYKKQEISEFSVKPINDFNYRVFLKSKNYDSIESTFRVLNNSLSNQIKSLSLAANEKIIFSSLMHSKKIEKSVVNFIGLSGFLFFLGFIFGIILSFFKHYFNKND